MKQDIKTLIKKFPFIKNLSDQVDTLTEEVKNLNQQVKKQGAFPAGHYYSPIPSEEEVLAYIKSRKAPSSTLPGIELNEMQHHDLLVEYTAFYQSLPFSTEIAPDYRYYYDNSWFSYSDAIFLYSFLRKNKPSRIIEIGSGFSSAVMLDTIDTFFPKRPEITFVEPYPDRLLSLLRDNDVEQVNLLDMKIQDVSPEIFIALESGDLLFIDSSHVVKCGSDLQYLMFEILPRLKPGVFVHFHDIFYPFDYPSNWLTEGKFWNENYILRAFLSYNTEWSIHFFNTYAHFAFSDLIKEKMPLCIKNKGGSLYIQRRQ